MTKDDETTAGTTLWQQNESLPTVAVLMSVYSKDDPKLFRRALESIFLQDYPATSVRIYLACDGPLTLALDQEINSRGTQIYHIERITQNEGLASALNRLIGKLQDEQFIFRMDADDFSLPDRFKAQIHYMRMHQDIAVLGTFVHELDPQTGKKKIIQYPSTPQKTHHWIAYRSPVCHPSVCMRTSAVKAVGGYPAAYRAQDVGLWFRMLAAGYKISNLESVHFELTAGTGLHKRRSFKHGLAEFKVWTYGIFMLHGLTWRYAWPVLRLMLRLAPISLVRRVYDGPLRNKTSHKRAEDGKI
jgi:glycosyltransferase involved in cell wall biosynthesis